jgi:hypothetical protein
MWLGTTGVQAALFANLMFDCCSQGYRWAGALPQLGSHVLQVCPHSAVLMVLRSSTDSLTATQFISCSYLALLVGVSTSWCRLVTPLQLTDAAADCSAAQQRKAFSWPALLHV